MTVAVSVITWELFRLIDSLESPKLTLDYSIEGDLEVVLEMTMTRKVIITTINKCL